MIKKSEHIWIGGKHTVLAYLQSNIPEIIELKTSHQNIFENLKKKIKCKIVKTSEINKLFKDTNLNHQGYALLIKKKHAPDFKNLLKNNKLQNKILILEDIYDPGNLGAIVRNAVAFNFVDIIIKKNQKILDSPFFFKSAVGTVSKSRIVFTSNISSTILSLKKNGYWIYGSSLKKSKPLTGIDFNQDKYVILFGSEGQGLKEKTLGKCDELFNIKMENNVESLNVSSSVAITLHHLKKKDPLK